MAKLGAIGTNEVLFNETALGVNLQWVVGTNGSYTGDLVTYTMPMTGQLVAEGLVDVTWPGNGMQGTVCDFNSSSPAPSVFWGSDCFENGLTVGNIIGQLKPWAVWSSLAKGTVVTLRLHVGVSFYASTVTFGQIYGMFRSYRT